jgi:peptidoglycan/xylan/chitin deacetylase (PgdA/CDA1 family)
MRRYRLYLLFAVLFVSMAHQVAAADYLGIISSAVSNIELGNYNEAASDASKALTLDDNDPLGHTAMGVIFLHTGRFDAAEHEFKKASQLKPDDWRAYYALGMVSIAQNQIAASSAYFKKVSSFPDSASELSALLTYRDYMSGRHITVDAAQIPAIPLAQQTMAMESMHAGKPVLAGQLLVSVLSAPALAGFEENRAPRATFNSTTPIQFPKGVLTWKPKERKDVPVVTGVVSLTANVGMSADVSFVSLFVDDALVGATNCKPFVFSWDTRNHSNGLHEVRMDGASQSGSVISQKTVWVTINNADSRKSTVRTGPEVTALLDRLWHCTRLSESRQLAHYYLAKLYLDCSKPEEAARHLEYAMAYQPDLLDASQLLKRIGVRRQGCTQISRGPVGSRMIALTFDDGPNERTEQLLDVLDKLNVRATFFLVGMVAETKPEIVRDIQAAGHEIENHTYTHRRLHTLSGDQVELELCKGAAVLRAITGRPSLYFRPPGGHVNDVVRQAASKQGLTCIMWTELCSPYEGARANELINFVVGHACDGAIVLMHDGEPGEMSSLPSIVAQLRAQGYRLVTLSELLSAHGSQTASDNRTR